MTSIFQIAAPQTGSFTDGVEGLVADIVNGHFGRVNALSSDAAAPAVPEQAIAEQAEPADASQPNGRLVTFLYLLAMHGLPVARIEELVKKARRHDDGGVFRNCLPSAGIGEWAKSTAKALEGGRVTY